MQFTFEDTLRREILPDLKQGRPNWDRPHTEAVVKHAKAILFQLLSGSADRCLSLSTE